MSGGETGHWRVDVQRAGGGTVPVRIAVVSRDRVEVKVGQGPLLVLSTRDLAELVLDLKAAGRMLRGMESAEKLVAEYGRPPLPAGAGFARLAGPAAAVLPSGAVLRVGEHPPCPWTVPPAGPPEACREDRAPARHRTAPRARRSRGRGAGGRAAADPW